LSKIEKQDSNKISGKDLLASMTEFKEIYLRDRMKNESHSGMVQDEESFETIDKSYLEVFTDFFLVFIFLINKQYFYEISFFKRKLLPEQPINKEEVQVLLENDWLNNRNENSASSINNKN
jgi:hypothetical protein